MEIRGLSLVEPEAVLEDQPDVPPELLVGFVDVQVYLVHDGAQIHGIGHDLEVVGAAVPGGVDWFAEEDAVVDVVLGEVEQFRADEHEALAPLALDLVGLHRTVFTFFWWMTGNISVALMMRSTSR